MIIYKAENKVNGKIYVGETLHKLETRIHDHFRMGGSPVFYNALKKYGIQNFSILVIDTAKSIKELNEKEKYWIKFYNCKVPNGYNLTDGGDGITGYIHTPEARKKISEKLKGRKREYMVGDNNPMKRPEVRKKVSNSQKVYMSKPEAKQKVSEKLRNRKFLDEHKEKLRRPRSQESKKRMSESRRGKVPWNKGLTKETDERVKKYCDLNKNRYQLNEIKILAPK